MIFNKPNLTFTQMAQWVDANSNNLERDDNKLVEYLYHLFFIRAEKCSFFNEYSTYEDFALFCVSKYFIRINNQFEAPVKSVVNYMNTVLKPWYSEYVRDLCGGYADVELANFNINDFGDYLVDIASEYDYASYSVDAVNIGSVARLYLSRIPIKKHSSEWSNICTSCLLTLQDRINCACSLSHKTIADDPVFLNRMIRAIKTKPPVLFHIDESYSTYISVLVNEIIHAIAMELTRTIHSPVSATSCLQNLVKAAYNDEDE